MAGAEPQSPHRVLGRCVAGPPAGLRCDRRLLQYRYNVKPCKFCALQGKERACFHVFSIGARVSGQRDKVVELVRWPQVLVLLLKRWKVVSLTPFQLENVPTQIDFETLLPVATDQAPYHLRAVIIHCGDAGAGHYTSYVRATDHRWYFCDDWSPPREVGVAEVLSERLLSQAYMLFYES